MDTGLIRAKTAAAVLAIVAMQIGLTGIAHGQASKAPARAQRSSPYVETVLHSFTGGPNDGLGPLGSLIRDANGTLYGTTYSGGITNGCPINNGCGIVFKLDANGTETVLHFFTGGADGGGPVGGLVRDSQGNFYGATELGGDAGCSCGVVYKLSPTGVETVLHKFTDAYQYQGPSSGLVRDAAGNLYGTTYTGGSYNTGSVFKVDANGVYILLHSFVAWDGLLPYLSPLSLDSAGNLYGMTAYGGAVGGGTVFKLDPSGRDTVLYGFTSGKDGSFPSGGVIQDSAGNFYGATYEGGSGYGINGNGVVFKLSASGKFTLLRTFSSQGHGGSYGGGLLLDAANNLYGTTSFEGANARGSVYKIGAGANGGDIYSFTGGADGDSPWAGVIEDSNGNLYGTTQYGGASGGGVVYKLTP